MVYVSYSLHKRKLVKNNINIKTIYSENGIELERNTNSSVDDTITNGIRIRKEYYLNNTLKDVETEFDTKLKYTFIDAENSEKKHKCKNCGMTAKLREYDCGCPYCGTYYNLDYSGKKNDTIYYNRLLRNKSYRLLTVLLDSLICALTAYICFRNTTWPFTAIVWYSFFLLMVIESIVLFFVLYKLNGYILLKPYKKYKKKINHKQNTFWINSKLDKSVFMNNFNYEVRKYYYNKENIIDFDILDFDLFKDYYISDNRYLEVEAYIRIVKFDGELQTLYKKRRFTFIHNVNCSNNNKRMVCYKCGAPINKKDSKCKNCNADIKYYQEWILI